MFFSGAPTRKKVSLGGRSRAAESREEVLERTRLERERRQRHKAESRAATALAAAWRGRRGAAATAAALRAEWAAAYGALQHDRCACAAGLHAHAAGRPAGWQQQRPRASRTRATSAAAQHARRRRHMHTPAPASVQPQGCAAAGGAAGWTLHRRAAGVLRPAQRRRPAQPGGRVWRAGGRRRGRWVLLVLRVSASARGCRGLRGPFYACCAAASWGAVLSASTRPHPALVLRRPRAVQERARCWQTRRRPPRSRQLAADTPARRPWRCGACSGSR